MRTAATSEVLHALADPTRRAFLERLIRRGEHTVRELTDGARASQPAAFKRLGVLKRAGLVRDRPQGRSVYYAAKPKGLAPLIDSTRLNEQWPMRNDFRPAVGHRFTFRVDPLTHWNGVTDCEVLAVEPNCRLPYRFDAWGSEASNDLETMVARTLTPTSRGAFARPARGPLRSNRRPATLTTFEPAARLRLPFGDGMPKDDPNCATRPTLAIMSTWC